MAEQITPRQFHEADGVEDWRVVGEGACACFRTGSFAAGARLVDAISELPDIVPHHPDVDLRHDGVFVRLITITADDQGLSVPRRQGSPWPAEYASVLSRYTPTGNIPAPTDERPAR